MKKDLIFGSGKSSYKDFPGLYSVCRVAIKNGIVHFDTAPSYKTEAVLSKAINACALELGLSRADYSLQTKIDPIQMYNGNIERYFEEKLKEMNQEYIDNLLIHWPVEKYLYTTWEALVTLQSRGLTKKIGICNLRVRHLNQLKSHGIVPEILQIERHPLNTFENEVTWCKENGVILQDYSPMCKMHPVIRDNEVLKTIAQKYDRNPGQIILRWHLDTGASPIFTSKNLERIRQYSQLDDFCLSAEEISTISNMNCNHKLYLESLVCPGF